tara:strand:- start:3184 stop:3708 length:525 start_codon:yes stop_codon:yes gene_type:complete
MIYEPSEDSYLIKRYIKKYSKNKKVLDVGTGSGILAKEALRYTKNVTASDINKECLKNLKGIKTIHSDLFKNIKGKYDLIICNPPYLPEDKGEDTRSALSTSGGKKGYELMERFLNTLRPHLTKDGKAIIIFSSLTNKDKVDYIIKKNNLGFKLLGEERNIPFEDLYCYLIFML